MSSPEHVAVVTDGSHGIGRAIALEWAFIEIKVAFTYRSSREAADSHCRTVMAA
jgi:NAD(P)-dependent dehydrogenase (short-subunit alcohol dehydrogenase family)